MVKSLWPRMVNLLASQDLEWLRGAIILEIFLLLMSIDMNEYFIHDGFNFHFRWKTTPSS